MQWVFDSEVYKNLYLVAFLSKEGDVLSFRAPLSADDKKQIKNILANDTVIGFNSLNYDLPLLTLALRGASPEKIKTESDRIIKNNLRWWQSSNDLVKCKDHIDLIEVAPGKASLKIYGGRLNSQRMQSLPIHFDAILTDEEKDLIEDYCINDLSVTTLLTKNLSKQLNIRRKMSAEYGVDLMSKSDAQIAETVIKKRLGHCDKRIVEPGYEFNYVAPDWMMFETPELKKMFKTVKNTKFVVQDSGKVKLPDEIKIVEVGDKKYKMGIGGLHSMEKKVSYYSNSDYKISDHDVASYYPSIILNEGLKPEHLDDKFLEVYKNIVDERLEAKASGDKVKADTLKIVINGSFGKFGSKYSILFAPEMLIQVTLTGQLALLMLIEMFEENGIEVLSANTDGVVVYCDEQDMRVRDDVIKRWELITRFKTEETRYQSLHSRDVNNYLAVKPDGSYKGKGCFARPSMSKNTEHPIVFEAVAKYLATGTPIQDTILSCSEMWKFCSIRTVKGGALDANGEDLGSAIRWYYSTDVSGNISYSVNGNKVPKTDGAEPMMEMGPMRDDVDYNWYVTKAKEVVEDVGI